MEHLILFARLYVIFTNTFLVFFEVIFVVVLLLLLIKRVVALPTFLWRIHKFNNEFTMAYYTCYMLVVFCRNGETIDVITKAGKGNTWATFFMFIWRVQQNICVISDANLVR